MAVIVPSCGSLVLFIEKLEFVRVELSGAVRPTVEDEPMLPPNALEMSGTMPHHIV